MPKNPQTPIYAHIYQEVCLCDVGKPALILPAGQQTDQPFWADIVRRQGLGPAGFLVPKLTPQKLADALAEGLSGKAFTFPAGEHRAPLQNLNV